MNTDLDPQLLEVAMRGILKARPKLEVLNDMTATSNMSVMRGNQYYEGAISEIFESEPDAEALAEQIRRMLFDDGKTDVDIMDWLKTERNIDIEKAKIYLDAVKSKFGVRKSYKVSPEYLEMNSEAVQYARKLYYEKNHTDEIYILDSLHSNYELSVMDGKKVFDAMIEKYGSNVRSGSSNVSATPSNRKPGGTLILVGAVFVGLHFFMHWEGKFMLFLGCAMVVIGLLAKFGKKQ